jgi:hypothetical protein
MIDELQRMWEAGILAYPDVCLVGLKKIIKLSLRMAGIPAGIRTEHLPNTSLEHFYARPPWFVSSS